MAVSRTAPGELPGVLGRPISTEQAVNLFGLAAGAFGGVAGLVAARRLEQREQPLPLGVLAVPVAVAGISTVVGAFLLPSGE